MVHSLFVSGRGEGEVKQVGPGSMHSRSRTSRLLSERRHVFSGLGHVDEFSRHFDLRTGQSLQVVKPSEELSRHFTGALTSREEGMARGELDALHVGVYAVHSLGEMHRMEEGTWHSPLDMRC